jgi:hypothetical protein
MVRLTQFRSLWVSLLLCSFFFIHLISNFVRRPRGYTLLDDGETTSVEYGVPCSPFASGGLKDLTIVLKLGAGEVTTRLPQYLRHMGKCDQDVLLFSDRKDSFEGREIHDALANLRPELTTNNPDFSIYNTIQQAISVDGKTHEGWRLDKYKFLPMMEHTYHLRPQTHWFIFIELDTYVDWDNLHRFLVRFDPSQSHYFGSPVWPPKKPVFAHGGTGVVLSQSTLSKLVANGKMFDNGSKLPGTHLFGKAMQEECCGDEVLAGVLDTIGIRLGGYWPMFNGEKPSTIRFGREQWCEAILTMHHFGVEDFAEMAKWEAQRPHRNRPLTFVELFGYIEPSLWHRVEDWTNMSEDVELHGGPGESFDDCHAACIKDRQCMQFEYVGNVCHLSYVIRLGHSEPPEAGRRWESGWMLERIQRFKATDSPCEGAHMVHPNPS